MTEIELHDVYAAVDALELLTPDQLRRQILDTEEDPHHTAGWSHVAVLLPILHRRTAALARVLQDTGGWQRGRWLDAQAQDGEAEKHLLRTWDESVGRDTRGYWPAGGPLDRFMDAAELLLALDPQVVDRLCAGPTSEAERVHVRTALERAVARLDRLDRVVNMRGNWPR